MTPEEIQNRILYRDALMLVINKPWGIPVHAGPRGGENMEDYFDFLRFGLPRPPFLAHRLDRDTSGCLILGRNKAGLQKLGKLFETARIEKTYWAIVEGVPAETSGIIDQPLEKIKTPKGWTMKPSPKGQTAVTEWKLMGVVDGNAWLEFYPKTGRTHQIRVHARFLGHPIIGDWMYGSKKGIADDPPLNLHARSVIIPLYPKKEPIHVEAPHPKHMVSVIDKILESQA